MQYALLVHLLDVRDHGDALCRIVAGWNAHFAIPMLSFSNKGPGRTPDASFLEERSRFGRLDNEAYVTLRESRKRGAPTLDVYFTNPARAFLGDLNFVAATLPATWLASVGTFKAEQAIVGFTSLLEQLGCLSDASFENEAVSLQTPGCEVTRAISVAYGCIVGHIAYFNRRILEAHGGEPRLVQAGFTIHRTWRHGSLAGIPFDLDASPVQAAWKLFAALEALGLFDRRADAAFLHESMPSLSQIGAFLNAFEEKLGRTFARRTQAGLEPVGAA